MTQAHSASAEPAPIAPATEAPKAARSRHSGAQQAFHWLSVLLVFAVIVLGWIMAAAGAKANLVPLWEWHKTLGVVIFLITIVRLAWRAFDPPPPPLAAAQGWDLAVARCTYIALFAALLIMPISGYMMSAGAGYPPVLFNAVPSPALIDKNPLVQSLGKQVHLAGQWLIYGLLLLHFAGVFLHVALLRDRTLDRMLPEPRG